MSESINPLGTKHHHNRGLAEGSWKGMKKYLEQDMLCDALKGRVVYDFTWNPRYGAYSCVFAVSLDGVPIKKFGMAYAWKRLSEQGFQLQYVDDVRRILMADRKEYTDEEFSNALRDYRNQSIDLSIASDNPIIRMFTIVDRRIGKRTLESLKDEIPNQLEWLKPLYVERMKAEGVLKEGEQR